MRYLSKRLCLHNIPIIDKLNTEILRQHLDSRPGQGLKFYLPLPQQARMSPSQVVIDKTRVTHQFADTVRETVEKFAQDLLLQKASHRDPIKVRGEDDSSSPQLAGPCSAGNGKSPTIKELSKDSGCRTGITPQEVTEGTPAFHHTPDRWDAILAGEPNRHRPKGGQGVYVLMTIQVSGCDARRHHPFDLCTELFLDVGRLCLAQEDGSPKPSCRPREKPLAIYQARNGGTGSERLSLR